MRVDFDAYAGAVMSIERALRETVKKTGFQLEPLTQALFASAIRRRDKREAGLWKNASSQTDLGKWIYNQAGRKFDDSDETKMLKFAKEIPFRVRRGLIEISEQLPGPPGGKPRALDNIDGWMANREVRLLRAKGLSKEKAYAKIAKKMKVSSHTIRRECEPKERERSREKTADKWDLGEQS
ncbi:MAG: hypothetical protein WCD49_14010 [Candidatus Acidiferrales bacterium]